MYTPPLTPSSIGSGRHHMTSICLPRRFPYCIVWTPIPLVTWLLPFIGHMGFGLSSGVILDFAAPYYISYDQFAFGNPTRYIQLDPEQESEIEDAMAEVGIPHPGVIWDQYARKAMDVYQTRYYNFVTDNCHCFVAQFLNGVKLSRRTDWNTLYLAAWMFFRGKYVSTAGFLKQWLPWAIIVSTGAYFGRLYFLVVYAGMTVSMLMLFVLVTLCTMRRNASRQPRWGGVVV